MYSYGSYEGTLRKLIHVYKYDGVEPLAAHFGKLLAQVLPREEQYFTLFAQMTSYINDAATTLVEMLSHRDGDYQRLAESYSHSWHTRLEIDRQPRSSFDWQWRD